LSIRTSLKEFEITIISLDQHTLASKYCRTNFQQGGMCIYVRKSIQFTNIYNLVTCKEKDLELCGIQVHSLDMCIVCIYRAPTGDFYYFLENFDKILDKLFENSKKYNNMWGCEHK
jgi:hypothetical protein